MLKKTLKNLIYEHNSLRTSYPGEPILSVYNKKLISFGFRFQKFLSMIPLLQRLIKI